MTRFGLVLVAKSLKPNAAMSDPGRAAISRAAKESETLCLIVDYYDIDIVIGAAGPKRLVDQFRHENNAKPVSLGDAKDYAKHLARQIGEGQWPAM